MSGLFGQPRSGPAGLSINTGSANSLFPTNTSGVSQEPSGGLFGGSGTSKPSMFGSTATTAPSAGTLFGTSTSAATQGGGLFSTAAQSKAGTLFGGTAASQNGSLFGVQTNSSQPQQQQSAPTGSLFGQSTQGGSLFGNTSQPQQASSMFNSSTQPQQSSSLFGTAPSSLFGGQGQTQQPQQPQQPQQNSGLFGQPQQSQQNGGLFGQSKPASSLFNNQPTQNPQRPAFAPNNSSYPPQQPQRSAFAASIGQYTAAAQSVPGVRIDLTNLKPTTRFEELHETLQKEISALDTFILTQASLADECSSMLPKIADLTATIPADVDFCEHKLKAAQDSLETDASAIDSAKRVVRADAEDARRSFKAIHALRLPTHFHAAGLFGASGVNVGPTPGALNDGEKVDAEKDSADLVAYFSAQADDMARKLKSFKSNLDEVEQYLAGVEMQTIAQIQSARMGKGVDAGARSADDKVRELAGVLREFEGGILMVAGSVGETRELVQEAMLAEGKIGGRWGRR